MHVAEVIGSFTISSVRFTGREGYFVKNANLLPESKLRSHPTSRLGGRFPKFPALSIDGTGGSVRVSPGR